MSQLQQLENLCLSRPDVVALEGPEDYHGYPLMRVVFTDGSRHEVNSKSVEAACARILNCLKEPR